MNLYLYDEKHERVYGELALGKIDDVQEGLLAKIIEFLDTTEMTTRYKRLVLAESYQEIVEDGETTIVFDHEHEWFVYSTALAESCLMLQCQCGANGVVLDPSKEEWGKAFSAPSKPYRWYENSRVTVHESKRCT